MESLGSFSKEQECQSWRRKCDDGSRGQQRFEDTMLFTLRVEEGPQAKECWHL